jgi:hypothetical protein
MAGSVVVTGGTNSLRGEFARTAVELAVFCRIGEIIADYLLPSTSRV